MKGGGNSLKRTHVEEGARGGGARGGGERGGRGERWRGGRGRGGGGGGEGERGEGEGRGRAHVSQTGMNKEGKGVKNSKFQANILFECP